MIYYFMFDTEPSPNNPERKNSDGAFINCWVRADSEAAALAVATRYVEAQGWVIDGIEQQFIAERDRYVDDEEFPESLEAFDHAVRDGIGAVFYLWSEEQGDEG